MITIEIKSDQGTGKTHFIRNVLIPAMEKEGLSFDVLYDEMSQRTKTNVDFIIIEKR